MTDPKGTEIRQIKRILFGMLVCLVAITLKFVPEIIPIAVIAAIVYVLFKIVFVARVSLLQLWTEISSLWRR
jgi:hypothetical protein